MYIWVTVLVQELKSMVPLYPVHGLKKIPCSRDSRALISPTTWFLCTVKDVQCKTEESPQSQNCDDKGVGWKNLVSNSRSIIQCIYESVHEMTVTAWHMLYRRFLSNFNSLWGSLGYIEVHKATRWTFRHGLMLLWFKDLMNVTKKLKFIDPTFWHSCLVP